MLENNPHLTSREIAEEFGIHHTTVGDHIKSLGFVLKQSVWVPHELTEKNLIVNIISNSSKTKYPSMKSIALFVVGQERSSVLRVTETRETIDVDLYCNQLDKLNAAIKEKRPALASRKGIVFHDNAPPYTAVLTTKTKCVRMGSPWSPTAFT
ncbi:mariner Mos1 transposase [Trichonephila clavipes]|nr:mariner Mos1 transposase [Trichonephila clavipes]